MLTIHILSFFCCVEDIEINITRTGYKKLKLQWKQANNYTQANYIISKYDVIVERGNSVIRRA